MGAPARWLVAALGIVLLLALGPWQAAARDVLWQAKDELHAKAWADIFARADRSDRHPLDGTIVALSVQAGAMPLRGYDDWRFGGFLAALRQADFVLLGEVHDNPYHHTLRGQWLGHLARYGHNAPLVSEHFRADQQEGLDRFAALAKETQGRATAGDLFRLVEWSKSGWQDETIFEPLYAEAIASGRRLLPAEPARGTVRTIARGGIESIPEAERQRLGLDRPFPEPLRLSLAAELKDGHCGLLPESAIAGLLLAQRYRDAFQADALLRTYASEAGLTAAGRRQAILIAGNGHVRRDRGVPYVLKARAPEHSILVVQLVETRPGVEDVAQYVPRGDDGAPTADFIVLTPRQPRPDPCEEMRRHMQKRREGQPAEKK